jgi:glycosyltransferase involved in cell wall biosynthesis
MNLSIVVLSYNRPRQIERILRCFVDFYSDDIELIIKDDKSPRREEIKELINRYSVSIGLKVYYSGNDRNLGYDLNLLSSFNVSKAKYIMLLSDDDYILPEKLPLLVNSLEKTSHDVFISPYTLNGVLMRSYKIEYSLHNIPHIIYNSILFSGLVFKRQAVNSIAMNRDFLSNCIYIQVYLAVMLILKNKSYGVSPGGIVFVGGDGENFFGKNQSAIRSDQLSNRGQVESNFKYQQFLLAVVDEIADKSGLPVARYFRRQYSIRLISYAIRIRSTGFNVYLKFIKAYFTLDVRRFLFVSGIFLLVIFIPARIAELIYDFGVSRWRKSG